jgi:glycine/D-amino acid oxidase-like deaminating enzyme
MKRNLDVLILGGGIAGLWTAALARARGLRVALLESQKLGCGQTLGSQGIIHGGLKYALIGQVNDTARRIAEVSREWLAAIDGKTDVDLRGTKILAPMQHLLVPGGMLSTLAGAMGHAVFGDTIQNLPKEQWPDAARDLGFNGQMIAMHEPGIDVSSALNILAQQLHGCCYRYDPAQMQLHFDGAGAVTSVQIGDVILQPKKIVALAAAGNDDLAARLGIRAQSQRRPLNMVFIKGSLPVAFWHGVTANPRPTFTISTHMTQSNETVWYLGGGVAEDGVVQDRATLFKQTAKILQKYLPQLSMENMDWANYAIERIEGLDPHGRLPDRPSYQHHHNVTLGWVNKLTFAPLLARELLAEMHSDSHDHDAPLPLSPAAISETPWDTIKWQKH